MNKCRLYPRCHSRNRPRFLLIPIRKNLSVFLPGKASVSIRRNPHFTRQP